MRMNRRSGTAAWSHAALLITSMAVASGWVGGPAAAQTSPFVRTHSPGEARVLDRAPRPGPRFSSSPRPVGRPVEDSRLAGRPATGSLPESLGDPVCDGGSVAWHGQPLPDGEQGTLSPLAFFNPATVDDEGRIAFYAQVEGADRNQGIFTADAEGLQVVALGCGGAGGSGETAGCGDPSPIGGSYSGFFAGTFFAPDINDSGDVLFIADIHEGDAPRGLFLYRGDTGAIDKVAAVGDSLTEGVIDWLGFGNLNNDGIVVFAARLADAAETELFRWDGTTTSRYVAVGDPAPGGGVFSLIVSEFLGFPDGTFMPGGPLPGLNDQGQITFRGILEGDGTSRGLLLSENGVHEWLVRAGDPVPGGGTYLDFQAAQLNDAGEVAFFADFDDGGEFNNAAWIAGSPGNWRRAVTFFDEIEGGLVQGVAFSRNPLNALNDEGDVLLWTRLLFPDDSTADTMILSRAGGERVVVAQQGEPTPDGGTYGSMDAWPALNDAGQGQVGAGTPGLPGQLNTHFVLTFCDAGAPALAFDPASLDFGDVEVGTTSDPMMATLQNTGDADATGLVFSTPGDGFDADTGDCGPTLPAGSSCDIRITFTPSGIGQATATLEVSGDDEVSADLGLTGIGVELAGPIADISPDSFAFELMAGDSETQTLDVGNLGSADLVWSIEPAEAFAAATPARTTASPSLRAAGGNPAADARRSLLRHRELAAPVDPELDQDPAGNRASGVRLALGASGQDHAATAAGDAAWSSIGPPGGDVFAVGASPAEPDIVLAGIAPGGDFNGTLYRSTDGGATWSEVAELTGTSVYDIEFAPDGTVYLGTEDAVWRSTDGGLTWIHLELDHATFNRVFAVTLDPSDSSTLWVGVAEGQPVNLLRSTDGGETWDDRTPPLAEPSRGRGIAVDPDDSDTVIAAFGASFGGSGVWVTTNGGETWTDRTAGLPENPIHDVVYDGTRLLVGGGDIFSFQFVGLYESTDLGVTWTALHDDTWEIPIVDAIAVDPNDPQTILVATDGTGVHRTTDGGESWELGVGGTDGLFGRALRFRPGSSTEVDFGTSSLGVFRSTDGGDAFAASSDGITETNVFSIAANPLDRNELAVGFQGLNNGGVLTSTDGGVTWVAEPIPPTRSNAVRFAPDGTLYSLNGGPTNIAQEGLYRRESDGNWIPLGPDQGDPTMFQSELGALRISATDSQLILAGGRDSIPLGGQAAIWRSLDGGDTWERAYEADAAVSQFVTDIEIVEDGTDQEMVAVFTSTSNNQGGALRSTDGGATWLPSSAGLPEAFLRDPSLCGSSADPQALYLALMPAFSTTSLFASGDGGETWEATDWQESGATGDLACDPVEPETLYVARQGGGLVARSEDGGATFEPFADGLEDVITLRELAFAGSGRLLLGSRKGSYATGLPGRGPCDDPVDVPWLSVSPDSGTTPPEGSVPVAVMVDATDLEEGQHSAQLCVTTNDPNAPLVVVPITLIVTDPGLAELTFEPTNLDFGDVEVGTTSPPQITTLSNTGDTDATGLSFDLLGGGFDADTSACGDTLPADGTCEVSVTFTPSEPGPAKATLAATSAEGASVDVGLNGNGVGDGGFTAIALQVDPSMLDSDGNGLFEPGEQVEVAPAWRNEGDAPHGLSGTAADFQGPDGATYTLALDEADYGLIEPGDTASCLDTEVCYRLALDDPTTIRPATLWEATFDEELSDGTTKTWTLHIGDSFPDVPRSSLFYTAIETLLGSGVTGGCGAGEEYCPNDANSRSQMPVFMLRALMGPDYTPSACVEGEEPFDDVPFDSTFCPWIKDLADRDIVSGCGDGNYCPSDPVSRAQMAIFILRTLEGDGYEPPACTNQFTDVPCPSLFADWIEDLAARGITGGCTATEYCPSDAVTRGQMAVFITRAFGFTLYGP